MRKLVPAALAILFSSLVTSAVFAQTTPDTLKKPATNAVAPVLTNDLYTVISNNPKFSTTAAAIKTANLQPTLQSAGPFTVFAPDNTAFAKLPSTQVNALMKKPAMLATVLQGHVVAGKYTKTDLIKLLIAGKGMTTLTTVDGRTLNLSVDANRNLSITDNQGNTAQVATFDMMAGNGVVHVINAVLAK